MYDYKGAIHVHSTHSDGTGDVAEIMKGANEAGLDFVILTDHDSTAAQDAGEEKWHDSSLLICGAEISPEKNHYLAVGDGKLKQAKTLKQKSPQEVIDAVAKQGFLGFISHPNHGGNQRFSVPAKPWEAWDATGFTGMGLWDLRTDWQSKVDAEKSNPNLFDQFTRYLSGPNPETLARWDAANQTRRVVGIGELDNHKDKLEVDGRTFDIFPYDTAFKTVTNHLQLPEPLKKDAAGARKQILEALAEGRIYISFDWWNDPAEFVFEIDEEDQTAAMGGELALIERAELAVTLSGPAHLIVKRNGKPIHEAPEADEALLDITEPGVYRVEAYQNNLPWILSNPIRVTGGAAAPSV